MAAPLDEKTVRKLERKLEEAIAGVIVGMGLKQLPLLPAHKTIHLMAKAAAAVYEAAVDNRRSQEEYAMSLFTSLASLLPLG